MDTQEVLGYFFYMAEEQKGFSTFQLAKACGISRATILRLEQDGFIFPSYIDNSSGKRFYSFCDAARVIQILTLRSFGLQKPIIHNFFDDQENYQVCLDVLQEQVEKLTRIIRVVKNWQNASDEAQISHKKIAAINCYRKELKTNEPLLDFLIKTFEEVIALGYEINISRTPFLQIYNFPHKKVYACIPVLQKNMNNIVQIPSCRALSIQLRSNIQNTPRLLKTITTKIRKHGYISPSQLRIHLPYDEFTRKNYSNPQKVLKIIVVD